MFRSQYDSDVTLYSPEGKLLQIEYSNSACIKGEVLICVKSVNHAVFSFVDKKREYKITPVDKIFFLSSNIIIGVSGIIGDSKIICELLKNELKEYEFINNTPMPVFSLARFVSKFFHTNTIYRGTRPFGISIMLAGYDITGLHLFRINQDNLSQSDSELVVTDSRQYKKNKKLFSEKIKLSSIHELIYHILIVFLKNETITSKTKPNICCVGKKLKATFFGYRIKKFFLNCFFNSMISV
ncbi:26s proteasome SU A6 (nucleomorph) [Cryptomonas paramecium]|uniref:Proteasome subunit alpha type n=1 Tax=Cryptomonas paramaecium TaxID=2898 RepID=F2HI35_9CRYP|nr:26s proteasome SU A6 [Cryptomonas paramecium]AEA38981.1 26s proteasome SU A6 [Cryptomonas paramecium]|mmetsp:Transcript_16021/g.43346  ORF Transcript_16021/g.43346 Transcript_16021/m.43346 type:complete len:240 (+) Transcript_16021:1501-2220(+)